MRITIVTAVCGAAIFSAACQLPSPPPPVAAQKEQAPVDPANVAFGYADSTGSKLLMLAEDNRQIDLARAETMASAVCSEGREFPIRYAQFQKRTAADNGRQSAGNFANDEDHVFEMVQGQSEPDDTCLLVPAGYLRAFAVSRNDFPKAERDGRRDEYRRLLAVASIRRQPFDLTPFLSLNETARQRVSRIDTEKPLRRGRHAQFRPELLTTRR